MELSARSTSLSNIPKTKLNYTFLNMNHFINLKRIVFIHLMALPVAEIAYLWSFTFSLLFFFQLPFYRTVSSTQPPCFTVINMVDVVMLSNLIVCGFPTCTKHMLVSKQLGAWIKHTKLNRLWASSISLIFSSNDQDPVCEIHQISSSCFSVALWVIHYGMSIVLIKVGNYNLFNKICEMSLLSHTD